MLFPFGSRNQVDETHDLVGHQVRPVQLYKVVGALGHDGAPPPVLRHRQQQLLVVLLPVGLDVLACVFGADAELFVSKEGRKSSDQPKARKSLREGERCVRIQYVSIYSRSHGAKTRLVLRII